MTQRLQPVIDLNYGEQEVLQRMLAEPQKIANALAPNDARENSRIVGVLEQLADAFSEVFFPVVEQLPDSDLEQSLQDRGMSR